MRRASPPRRRRSSSRIPTASSSSTSPGRRPTSGSGDATTRSSPSPPPSHRPPGRGCWCARISIASASPRGCSASLSGTRRGTHSRACTRCSWMKPRARACARRGWLLRRDCQFHWSNRGYESFEAYLATFTAEKRKKARRERRRVEEAGRALRDAPRRGARRAPARSGLRTAPRHLPAPRTRALPDARLLQRDRPHAA